jgi:hypothetical protein
VAAIGAALFLETSGFGTGVYHHMRRRLADVLTARSLIILTVPLGVAGAVLAHHAPVTWLRLGYGGPCLARPGCSLTETSTDPSDDAPSRVRASCVNRSVRPRTVPRTSGGN